MNRCQAAVALRSLAFGVWMAVTVVPYAAVLVLASALIGGARLYWFAAGWNRLTIWGARAICGIEHRVQGWEQVDAAHAAGQPLIICAKHQSAWETFFLSVAMPRPLSYVFKRELLWIPFFGWALARLDMVHIDRARRGEASRKVAEQGRRMLDRGNWIILFPEGTRGPRGGQLPYKLGAARLAVDTDTPVLPVAVSSGRCWPKGWWVRPGVIDVSVGVPIPVEGRTPQQVMHEVEAWIEGEMRRLDPDAYTARSKPPGALQASPGGSRA